MSITARVLPAAAPQVTPVVPEERHDQAWALSWFVEDAGLARRNILDLAFERDGTVWVASSDGLFRYDGYRWERLGVEHGLPSGFIRSVLVTRNGELWVGTDKGAGVYDGRTLARRGSDQGLAGPSVRRIVEDPDGTLWFCCDRWPDVSFTAGLTAFKDGRWATYRVKDGLPSDHVFNYFRDSRGQQFVLTDAGMAQWNGRRWERQAGLKEPEGELPCWSMAETATGEVLAPFAPSVMVLQSNRWEVRGRLETKGGLQPTPLCRTHDGEVVACVNETNQLVFCAWRENGFVPVSAPIRFKRLLVESTREAPDGSIWTVGNGVLARWERQGGKWNEFVNLPPPQFRDAQNRVWFFTSGTAVWLRNDRFERVADVGEGVAVDGRGAVWTWGARWLRRFDAAVTTFTEAETGLVSVFRCVPGTRGEVWFSGLDRNRRIALARYDGSTWRATELPESAGRTLLDLVLDAGGEPWYLLSGRQENEFQVAHRRGNQVELFPIAYNRLFSALRLRVEGPGAVWLFGSGLFRLSAAPPFRWERIPDVGGNNILSCLLRNTETWFSFDGTVGGQGGIACYRAGQWQRFPADTTEFASLERDGTLYFGNTAGLDVFLPGAARPSQLVLPGNKLVTSLAHGSGGELWLGVSDTTQGGASVLRYRPDHQPPDTRVVDWSREVRGGGRLKVECAGGERFVPRKTERWFSYSWRIDNRRWSEFQPVPEDGLDLAGLTPGQHLLEVRARDEDGVVDPTPARAAFRVLPVPWEERAWFMPATIGLLVLLLGLALLALERAVRSAKAEAKYHDLYEEAPVGYHELDTQGRIVRVNRTELSMLGYAEAEMIGRPVWEFVVEAVSKEAVLAKLAGHNPPTPIERTYRRADGFVLPVLIKDRLIHDPQGRIRGIRSTLQDISARKAAEQALHKARAELEDRVIERTAELSAANDALVREVQERREIESALRCSETSLVLSQKIGQVGSWELDLKTQALTWSQETYRLFGRTPGEWIPTREHFFELVHPDDRPRVQRAIEEAVRTGGQYSLDHRILLANGAERALHEQAEVVFAADGPPTKLAGMVQDITERKQLEAQLRQAQKMEAVGQLAGGVAHDFNNLLTIIEGHVGLLLAEAVSTPATTESLKQIAGASERATNLTRQLLAFSRRQVLQRRPIDLSDTVSQVAKMLHRLLGEHIRLHFSYAPDLPAIEADPGMIEQILLNLAVNARDAMPEGGQLTLTMTSERIAADRLTRVPEARAGRYVCLAVADTGCGMSPQTLERLFEPFFTTKEVGKGTGLGLATVYGIVKQHQGWIEVESEPGRGSTFKVFLPASNQPAPTAVARATAKPASASPGGSERILVVEDEPALRNLVRNVLQRAGYKVFDAASAVEALGVWELQRGQFDLLLTDLVMPEGMSGQTLATRLLNQKPTLKVIYSTGYSDELVRKGADWREGENFLPKPYTPDTLCQTVRRCLNHRAT